MGNGKVADPHDIHPSRSRAVTFPLKNHSADTPETTQSHGKKFIQNSNGDVKRCSTSPAGRLKVALKSQQETLDFDRKPNYKDIGIQKERIATDNNRGSIISRFGSIFNDNRAPQPVPPLPLFDAPKKYPINSYTPPRTPVEKSTPLYLSASVTPAKSTPNLRSQKISTSNSGAKVTELNVATSTSEAMTSSGRTRSGSTTVAPSRLSKIASTPLSPTPEISSNSPNQEGFFSTVLSAAQNAASSLSSSISSNTATSNVKIKKSLPDLEEITTTEPKKAIEATDPTFKPLGMGDLSLDHLGITENKNGANISTKGISSDTQKGRIESAYDLPTTSLIRSSTVGTSMMTDSNTQSKTFDETPSLDRSRTTCDPESVGIQTPHNSGIIEGNTGIQRSTGTQRSNSSRSGIGCRRKRTSSATTCTTIGAAILAANSSLAQPSQVTPKITGYAVASKKRNNDFHQLFRSVPDDDYLIEDYSCALQREILAHGRLYVSEGHLCFSSNIFGWVTTLVMSYDEICSVEKRSTALVFKNGLMINTLHAKHVFASFTTRDSTYDLIVRIWKLRHPSLKSSLNGVHLAEIGGSDKTEKGDSNIDHGGQSDSDSDGEEENDDIYDEDEDDEGEDSMSFTNGEESFVGSDVSHNVLSKKASNIANLNGTPSEKSKEIEGSGLSTMDFPGPLTHGPTENAEKDISYSKIVADELIQAPIGKVWNLIFGSGSQTWFRNFLIADQKCFNYIPEENAKKPLGTDNRIRNYSYIKPLNGPIGPKQTKCICIETLDFLDFEKYITVTISTQTPDVPSGNIFSVKTRYCFSWGSSNNTRLQMSYVIEWAGKSWLKGPIEKGAADGQVQYARDIVNALRNTLSSSRNISTTKSKGKKSRQRGKEGNSFGRAPGENLSPKSKFKTWGPFEFSRDLIESFVSIIRPILTGNIMYGILVGLLVASWFQFGSVRDGDDRSNFRWQRIPEKLAAYEDIWRKEESELWRWLEDRVEMELLRDTESMPVKRRKMEKILEEETYMQELQVEDAIRITEKKLQALKESYKAVREQRKVARDTCPIVASGGVESESDDTVLDKKRAKEE